MKFKEYVLILRCDFKISYANLMKMTDKSNICKGKRVKITLRDYYNNLPDAKVIAPKSVLIGNIAEKCEVSLSTARNWCGGFRPRKQKWIDAISEVVGIPAEELF